VDTDKDRIRRWVWATLQAAGADRFPYGSGRIPNFAGASEAARRLAALPEFRDAAVLKCNPDYTQLPLRRLALRAGKVVYMAAPRLRGEKPFVELDPARLAGREAAAATIGGAARYGRLVAPEEMRLIDAVICGSVAVNRDGGRLGKGGGFSDLEYAIARQLGLIRPATPVMTTVHQLQVIEEPIPMLRHDIVVTHFATPAEAVRCRRGREQPDGIRAELLNEEQRQSIPVLRRFLSA
jgi:5-formyltetrahydrofolate cyclo-ligase